MENKETLASALCKAQSEFTPAAQSGYNPHFKSSFSTMTDLIRATRPALSRHGIVVSQYPVMTDKDVFVLRTDIMYSSMQYIRSDTPIILKDQSNTQEFGKACSYITRYVYKMMLMIEAADEDDDGNESAGYNSPKGNLPNGAASEAQIKFLKQLLSSNPTMEQTILKTCKVDDLAELPRAKVSELITLLKPEKVE